LLAFDVKEGVPIWSPPFWLTSPNLVPVKKELYGYTSTSKTNRINGPFWQWLDNLGWITE
jgi:hypothetical protein